MRRQNRTHFRDARPAHLGERGRPVNEYTGQHALDFQRDLRRMPTDHGKVPGSKALPRTLSWRWMRKKKPAGRPFGESQKRERSGDSFPPYISSSVARRKTRPSAKVATWA